MRMTSCAVPRRRRAGFTLIEMVVSMTVLLIVLAISVGLLRNQNKLFAAQLGRQDAEQNARFAISSIERELRMAGAGVVNGQPTLVSAGATSIVFNVDLVSRTPGDIGSVDVDTTADSLAVSVFHKADAIVLPGTALAYPETTYMKAAGVESGAETISYYLSPDSTSGYSNEYILFRRVNAAKPEVMARGIVHTSADTVFQYFKSDTSGNVTAVASGALPLVHAVAIDGSVADTGRLALVDSIVAVRVSFTVVFHDPHGGSITRKAATMVRILNAGLPHATVCGDPPIGVAPSAAPSAVGDSVPHVTITWVASLDESGGQKSVERYMLYKRPSTATAFSESFATVPAGSSTYTYTDNDVRSGDTWIYGVSAQDCTPSNSSIGTTAAVLVP